MASINEGEISSQGKVTCRHCNSYNLELKDIIQIAKEKHGLNLGLFKSDYEESIFGAVYHCLDCDTVTIDEVDKRWS
ncbi:MAG: hypothetical protein QXN55_06370 [Candidatus Nitrosotenuis sp.]